jgi:hypothetical protein
MSVLKGDVTRKRTIRKKKGELARERTSLRQEGCRRD